MNPFKAIMYFILVNGMLAMFTTISAYSTQASLFSQAGNLGASGWIFNPSNIIVLAGLTSIITGVTGGLLGYVGGVNPLQTLVLSATGGFFLVTFINLFSVMNNIANSLEGYSSIMIGMIAMVSSVFAISFLLSVMKIMSGVDLEE